MDVGLEGLVFKFRGLGFGVWDSVWVGGFGALDTQTFTVSTQVCICIL